MSQPTTKVMSHLAMAEQVIDCELEAIQALKSRLDEGFEKACNLCLACQGRIVVTGIGKSGHIGKKIASTLASTGTPAFFVHPSEACHGDLGMITPQDVILVLSYSGTSPELTTLLPLFKNLQTPLIAMTGRAHSILAEHADVVLNINVGREACPLGLAPTSSTTVSLVMGDALAIALLKARGFTKADFARSHPGGSLGKSLLLQAGDLMHKGAEIPLAQEGDRVDQVLVAMTEKRFGCVNIVNQDGQLIGIFTDGDLRRALDRRMELHRTCIGEVMTRGCITAGPTTLASTLIRTMSEHKITVITITDLEDHPIGIIHLHDLIQAGIF
jgi:arabinose-5-phosphate isomerase